jgi:simple sugar transport system permease protein
VAVIISGLGVDPGTAFYFLLRGSLGSVKGISETIVFALPMFLSSLGLIIAFRSRIFNIGSEGQMAIGVIAAAGVGIWLPDLPGLLFFVVIAGFIFGALWGTVPAILQVKLKVNIILSTLMLNFVALFLIIYFATGPWRDVNSIAPNSFPIAVEAMMPRLLEGTRLHAGFIVAIVFAIIVYFILWRTTLGYEMRTMGSNPLAAQTGGINIARTIIFVMILSGGLAGLGGMIQLTGVHHRIVEGITANAGYNAIVVTLLGRESVLGAALSAFLFAALWVGADTMYYETGISRFIVYLVEGLIILFVISGDKVFERLK